MKFSKQIRTYIANRAHHRCEYCHKPDIADNFTYHIEHIISKQHGGDDHPNNLAYACSWCNWKKGPNIATILEDKEVLIPLFNPRKHTWSYHFKIVQGIIKGKTNIGKGTTQLLQLNTKELVAERVLLQKAGLM